MVAAAFEDYTWLMVVGCIIAFGAAMGIGANDAANVSSARNVSSRALLS
jgi:phosphate/sulfate permease